MQSEWTLDTAPRVGIVGLGEHGAGILLPALRSLPGAHMVGLCDRDERKRASKAVASANTPVFAHYEVLIEEARPDVLVLAGPPQMHEEIAAHAIEHKIAVFAEKPPSVTTDSLEGLVATAVTKGVATGVGLNFRYSDPIQLIQQYMREYRLNPIAVYVKHTSSKPRRGLWGLNRIRAFLLAQAIHPLDTLVHFGGTPRSVHAAGYVAADDFTLAITIKFTNGGIGHLLTGSDSPKFESVLEVITTEDVVFRLDNMWNLSVLDAERLPTGLPDRKRWGLAWAPSPLSSGFGRSGYQRELESFLECVRTGANFSPSFADTLELYRVIDSVEEQIQAMKIG